MSTEGLVSRGAAAGYPRSRPRRLRGSPRLRALVRETSIDAGRLAQPLFVVPGSGVRSESDGLPGIVHLSVDRLAEEARRVRDTGVAGLLLFGLPEDKDSEGSAAWSDSGTVQRALRELRRAETDLLLMTDVCLCQYTDHGHCGVLTRGRVDNDRSVELIARTALSHARAGADVVAPSDMMDGRVGAIRMALDAEALTETVILSYAVKYASSFYGPFRDAAHSAPREGDRRSYQMDPANVREALREVALDITEGADAVMVKPATPCLDVVAAVRAATDVPVAAYSVSGEYAMVKAAAARGWLDEESAVRELLTGMRRAGADFVVTYHAAEAAGWLRAGS
ncbi:MAG: porphobilinogen synthase [Candidatus Dormibacteria bacterium]